MVPRSKTAPKARTRAAALALALVLALAIPLAGQQPSAGAAAVGTEALFQTGPIGAGAPGMGPDEIGWLGDFQQSFGADGVFTLSLDSATDGASWRNGNNQLAWRNLPFAGGRWFLRAGTLNFATDLLPIHFASLYAPDVYLSGAAVEYHLGGVRLAFFAGRELIQQGPYLPFFTSAPSGIGGVQARFTPLRRLTLEARYFHSRATSAQSVLTPLLLAPPARADNFYLDGDYRLDRNDDWLGEVSFSRARAAPGGGAAPRDALSYFFGPILSRPHFDIQAYALSQSADYLPLANVISGDRTGAFAAVDLHPSARWSLSTTLSDFHAGALGAAAFAASDALASSAAVSFNPGDGYSLTASASRGRISPTAGEAGPSLGLTTAQIQGARAYGDNRSYLRFQDWVSSSSAASGNSSVRTASFEQDRLIGADSLSAIVSLQQSSGGAVTLNGQLGGNLAFGHWLSLSGSAQLGRDLRDQTALSLETYRTIMVLGTLHLPRQFNFSAEWIHNASVSQLNPARVLVGLAAGPVPLLPALSQQTLLLRLTKNIHWGHGMPLLAGLSEADAERLVPTYATVSGIVFNDRLGTGVWAPGDAGVPGIAVTLSGRTAITDARGRFQFPAVRSGEYRLGLDMDHLPAQYSAPDAAPHTVLVGARATPRIAIPIQAVGVISGRVLANGRPLAGAELLLRAASAPGGAPLDAFTNAGGDFGFQDVLPGRYRLQLDLASAPAGATIAAPLPAIHLASGGTVQGLIVHLRAPVHARPVVTTVEPAEAIALPAPGAASAPAAPTAAAAPQPPATIPAQASLARQFRRQVHDIFFAFNQAGLEPAARATLRQDAAWLRAHPAVRVVIQGYADLRGGREQNRAVGQRRASAARAYLIGRGIAAGRLRAAGYGGTSRFCRRQARACWQSNRRDHLVIAR